MRLDAEKQMTEELEKSEIVVNCNIKAFEILAPDNINYEMSKFIIIHTGDIHVRSGESKRMTQFVSQNSLIKRQLNG